MMADKHMSIKLSHIVEDDFGQNKAYEILVPVSESTPRTNIRFDSTDQVKVRDARARGLNHFSLAQNGFQFHDHVFKHNLNTEVFHDTTHGEKAVVLFLQELQQFLARVLDAEKVILYDWRLRSHLATSRDASTVPSSERTLLLPPAAHVHADESAECGLRVVQDHATAHEKEALQSDQWRVRIINIWKPLVPVVTDNPLALCDWNTVMAADWELCDQIHADRCDEAMYLKQRSYHEWYWLPEQKISELSLFTVWDSCKVKTRLQASVPHAAFHIPDEPSTRASIEVRSVIWTRNI